MDSYAQRPQELAVQSQKSGFFDREIAPVTLADGTVVATDDGSRASSTLEKLSQLPEAFAGGGGGDRGRPRRPARAPRRVPWPRARGRARVLVRRQRRAAALGEEGRGANAMTGEVGSARPGQRIVA